MFWNYCIVQGIAVKNRNEHLLHNPEGVQKITALKRIVSSKKERFHKDNLRHLPRFPDFFVTFRILSSHHISLYNPRIIYGFFILLPFYGSLVSFILIKDFLSVTHFFYSQIKNRNQIHEIENFYGNNLLIVLGY